MKVYYSVAEVAQKAGVSRQNILAHIEKKNLPAIKNAEGHYRIEEDDIYLFIKSRSYDTEKFMLLSEAVSKLKITKPTILDYINKGALDYEVFALHKKKSYIITRESVEKLLKCSKKINRVPSKTKIKDFGIEKIDLDKLSKEELEHQFVTLTEATKLLNSSTSSMHRYFRSGIFTKKKLYGKNYVSKLEINCFLKTFSKFKSYDIKGE